MGQFLAVGLVTKLSVPKKDLEKSNVQPQEAINRIEEVFYFPQKIYDSVEEEDAIRLVLKNDLYERELLPFLEKFYSRMYHGRNTRGDSQRVLETLKAAPPATWLSMVEEKSFENYQSDPYSEDLYIKFDRPPYSEISIHCNCILLSLEGKIVMEVFGRQFNFFKYCIKETFKEFELGGAIRVYITG